MTASLRMSTGSSTRLGSGCRGVLGLPEGAPDASGAFSDVRLERASSAVRSACSIRSMARPGRTATLVTRNAA